VAETDERDAPEGSVGLSVAAAVEAVSVLGLAAVGWDG
jgi:hypothetical protein